MTVSSTELKTIVVSAGETTLYYFFPVDNAEDIKVYFTIAGLDVLQTAYTIDSEDLTVGGAVVFDEAPTAGTRITIIRETNRYQSTNYVENDPFPAEAHESALDKLQLQIQEIDERTNRCIRLPMSDLIETTNELPDLDTRKLQFIMFDQDGQLTTASGQLIESSHTHTVFDHLTINGILTVDSAIITPYLEIMGSAYIAGLEVAGLVVGDDLVMTSGSLTVNGDINATGDITAVSGTFTGLSVGSMSLGTLGFTNISGTNIDIEGYMTIGEDNGLKLSSTGGTSSIYAQDNGASTSSVLTLSKKESTALGGAQWTVLTTSYDNIYGHQVRMDENFIVGKAFRATMFEDEFPTFQGDGGVYIAAGDEMVFSIDKENIGDPVSFTWITDNYLTASGITLMTLTDSGTLTISGALYVNDVDVIDYINTVSGALQDQINALDIVYATDSELSAVSGTLHDEIVSVSGSLQYQIDDITTSGVLYSPQVDTFYFGGPTTSGTFRMTTVSGNLEVQWYDGIDWYTRQTISGAIA